MQVYKATGDVEGAKAFFGKYSEVDEKFLKIRDIVIANKKPRRLELQGNVTKCGSITIIYFEKIISDMLHTLRHSKE
jgi:dipeptidyl-peptidase-3